MRRHERKQGFKIDLGKAENSGNEHFHVFFHIAYYRFQNKSNILTTFNLSSANGLKKILFQTRASDQQLR